MQTSIPAPSEVLEESRRLIETLERCSHDMPLATDRLKAHRPAHEALLSNSNQSARAVPAWQAALAERWECEVRGRRLFKRLEGALRDQFGASSPELQLLSRGGAEAESSPLEMLNDLRRLRAAVVLNNTLLPTADRMAIEIDRMCVDLARAIERSNACESARRAAALERHVVYEAYRRLRRATCDQLLTTYGVDVSTLIA